MKKPEADFNEDYETLLLSKQMKQRFDASEGLEVEFRRVYKTQIDKALDIEIKDRRKHIEKNIVEPFLERITSPSNGNDMRSEQSKNSTMRSPAGGHSSFRDSHQRSSRVNFSRVSASKTSKQSKMKGSDKTLRMPYQDEVIEEEKDDSDLSDSEGSSIRIPIEKHSRESSSGSDLQSLGLSQPNMELSEHSDKTHGAKLMNEMGAKKKLFD